MNKVLSAISLILIFCTLCFATGIVTFGEAAKLIHENKLRLNTHERLIYQSLDKRQDKQINPVELISATARVHAISNATGERVSSGSAILVENLTDSNITNAHNANYPFCYMFFTAYHVIERDRFETVVHGPISIATNVEVSLSIEMFKYDETGRLLPDAISIEENSFRTFQVIGDSESDVGILIVNTLEALPVKPCEILGPEQYINLHIGQPIISSSCPFAITPIIYKGHIAGFDVGMGCDGLDINIAPGSSGGGVFLISGKLIGIYSRMHKDFRSNKAALAMSVNIDTYYNEIWKHEELKEYFCGKE